jgi:glycosyltransferase involved in cell wall biosynthesis
MEVCNVIFTMPFKKIKFENEIQNNVILFDRKFNYFERFIYFRKQHIIYKEIQDKCPLNEVDIIHAHTLYSSGFCAYLIKKHLGLPYIVAIRNTDVNVFLKYMLPLRKIGIKILNNAHTIIFLSPSYRDFVIEKYIIKKSRNSILGKSIVIPNGIDEYFLRNKFVKAREINIAHIKLIFIGDIDSNKNIETTIKACRLLIDKGYSVKYTIVGQILDSKYFKIISSNSFISYYNRCNREEVLFHLRQSDILVMPSVYETFGLVYAEAMSQGLPIIYSKGQGFDCQFQNGLIGYAVDSFDFKDICQKIIEIYRNYHRFSKQCISLVERFNWITIAKEYKEIYLKSIPTYS